MLVYQRVPVMIPQVGPAMFGICLSRKAPKGGQPTKSTVKMVRESYNQLPKNGPEHAPSWFFLDTGNLT